MLNYTDSTGYTRFLGNIDPGTDATRYSWAVYGTVPECPLVPRSEWDALVADGAGPDDPFNSPASDQDGVGMCNASATASAIEDCRAMAGLPPVRLSGGDLYRRICGGSDRGSLLEDGIREAMARGVASVATCPYLEWRRAPAGWEQDARKFRVLEAFLCPTFDHCFSAVLKGFRLITGILWYDNYDPDGDGWLPRPRGRSGGHAIKGYKPARRGREWGIWHRNSWTAKWGVEGGCFVIPESAYTGPVGGWWAVRAVTTEDLDTPAPKE